MLKLNIQQQFIPISLTTLLSCTAITWIATIGIYPSITLAKPIEFNLPIYRQPQESYNQFMQRSKNLAYSTINSRFKQDPSLDEIKVVIVGENAGAIAPVLVVKVSRQAWINSPSVEPWATYFTDSRLLLGFDQPGVSPAQPNAAVQPPQNDQNPASQTPQAGQPPAAANNPSSQTPEPQQIPIDEDPPQERQRNPLPVPTQRLRNAGNQLPFVDPVDVQQMRPDLVR
ncbi:hypothetical protein [Gloeothece verrucosa]|uniref:Uncharacterized protein n=1 Tax=Gloeothece verrucosa (strain PCC 7822) TaxID=497965 RepID=E0U6E4_GLOV7|nr:hypothetical protein [Gloeothece verrucosa]ADN13587.1 conserved hypothetical protein [Gloeothece verrucosa PCC 7822]